MTSKLRLFGRSAVRVLRFQKVMSAKEAIKVVANHDKPRETIVYVSSIRRNIVLRGCTSDFDCFDKIFGQREYESPFPDINPMLIVDAGANIGIATVYYATRYPNTKIIAIEPEPDNFDMLTRNCAGLPNVALKRAALWPRKESLLLTNPMNCTATFEINRST